MGGSTFGFGITGISSEIREETADALDVMLDKIIDARSAITEVGCFRNAING